MTFTGLAGYRISQIGLDNGSGAERVWGYLATGNYFDVVGVEPALGRFFHPGDDRRPGQARVYQATSRDPVVLGGVILTMGAAALFAPLGPARRALS